MQKKRTIKRYERMIKRAVLISSLVSPLIGIAGIGFFMFGVALLMGY